MKPDFYLTSSVFDVYKNHIPRTRMGGAGLYWMRVYIWVYIKRDKSVQCVIKERWKIVPYMKLREMFISKKYLIFNTFYTFTESISSKN